ncbi:RagB/SusD family nutrient uptake outer membrane protein [Pontibacter sp. G13]|uniref:RagB/SusD family nutrient uptake outer membrane protein n=1 Tax=Pontibacter sp. G13 TaxID=3074898 RepID=UPI00288B004C|nr:RagB/SusD family nutrient uptake outer membrane protein [Pontibacter sp. G13]WNJ18677.1 RagB/SusD family nutrient uptake outer membrane protein [Pontibacter sp. G13]
MKDTINTIALSCLIMGSTMFGCADRLDLQPISSIGENGFYNDKQEVEGGVIAIYDGLQNLPMREFALTEMRSDNTKTKSSEGDWAQFESFDVQPTNQVVYTYWQDNYNVIFRANRVLESLDAVEDAASKAQFEGEAKFARALGHFNLVRAYGDIPLIDRVIIQTDTDYFSKTDATAVLAAIEADLTDAAALLPTRSATDDGRATVAAAQGLLAKVKLHLGDYSGAQSALESIMNNAEYSLVDSYNDVFYDEMNSEIIFAIPYLPDNGVESQDFSFEMTNGGRVSGLNYITDNFVAAFDTADSERSAVLFNPTNADEVGKFLTSSSDVRLCGNDWIVLRLADVYLLHAEAIMAGAEFTSDASAIASYNAVRERVGLSTLKTDGSEALTRDALLAERRVELAFENHRLYDLVRMGVAVEVLTAFAQEEGYSFESTDLILPIPQAELNVSQGLLTQNPGY